MPEMSIRWLLRGGKAQLKLSHAESNVLYYLIDRSDKDGVCFPSQVRMAEELGMARSGVQKCLDRLASQDVGVVLVIAQFKGRSNGYRVVRPAHSVGTPPAHSVCSPSPTAPAHRVGTKYLERTNHGLPDTRTADDCSGSKASEKESVTASAVVPPVGGGGGVPATQPPRHAGVPAQPTYARTSTSTDWPTAIPGHPGQFTNGKAAAA